MDFVDEKDVAFFQIGEEPRKIAGFLDGRTARALKICAHSLGENVSEGGFAEAWWATEKDVVDGFVALFGGSDSDFETFFHLSLAGEFAKQRRPQRHFQHDIGFDQHFRNWSLSH